LTTGRGGADRIVVQSGTYTAKYRDGQGVVREVATGCRDETAARSVLSELERRAELVKAKVITAGEDATADHQQVPLDEHIAAYLTHLECEETTEDHQKNVKRCLSRIADGCKFSNLADLNREVFERCQAKRNKEGVGARTRNLDRASLVAFANWCVLTNRILSNPFTDVKMADEGSDPRRQRRAMSEVELARLLDVACRRPLLDAMTIRRGPNKGKTIAKLREETKNRLEQLGRERALLYKTLVLTGLRKGELASLTVGQLDLEGPVAFATLDPPDEKNREGNEIAIRDDLAADLRKWLSDQLAAL